MYRQFMHQDLCPGRTDASIQMPRHMQGAEQCGNMYSGLQLHMFPLLTFQKYRVQSAVQSSPCTIRVAGCHADQGQGPHKTIIDMSP